MKTIKKRPIIFIVIILVIVINVLFALTSKSLLGSANWIKAGLAYRSISSDDKMVGVVKEDPLIIISQYTPTLDGYLLEEGYEVTEIEGINFETNYIKSGSYYSLDEESMLMFGTFARYQLEPINTEMIAFVIPTANQFMAAYKVSDEKEMNKYLSDKYHATEGVISYEQDGIHAGINILPIISYNIKSYADMGSIKVIEYRTIFSAKNSTEEKTQDFQMTMHYVNGNWLIDDIKTLLY